MKSIFLSLCVILPLLSSAQTIETGINAGVEHPVPGNVVRASVYTLANFNKIQLGGGFETGHEMYGRVFIMPYMFVNRRFDFNRFYLYSGIVAGFKYQNRSSENITGNTNTDYSLGIQAGGVFFLNKHWGVNAETSLRASGALLRQTGRFQNPDANTTVMAGIRYRF